MVDKHIFDKQFMDLDTDSRLLPPNATRQVFNLRSGNTSTNGKGCLETLKSNLDISLLDVNIAYTPQTGTNWVEGKCQDVKNSALIIFVRNQNGHDAIYRIWSDNRIELIAQYDYFAFDKINHANVLGNLLYWTDGYERTMELGLYNPPRKFNIVRASAMTNQFSANKLATWLVGTTYTISITKPKVEYLGNLYESIQSSTGKNPVTETTYWRLVRTKFVKDEIVGYTVSGVKNCYQCLQDTTVELPTDTTHWKLIEYKHYDSLTLQLIARGKVPPFQPTWTQASSDIKINRLRGKIFQFRTRFIYDDDEKSTWSCISTPTLLNHEYNGYFSDPAVNNTLLVTFGTGTKEVVRIQVACRINGGDWVLVEDLHKYNPDFSPVSGFTSDSTYVYTFRNDLVTLPLDQTETNNLFSYTPQISNCQELIQGNRLVDADITEGYDYPTVTCTLAPRYATVAQPTETTLSAVYSSTVYVFTLPAFNTLTSVSVLKFVLPISSASKITVEYIVKNETTLPQVLANIVLAFADNGITAISDTVNGITVASSNFGDADFSQIIVPNRTGGMKYSSTVNPGIIYLDELKRSTSVVKLPSVEINSVNDELGGTTVGSLPVPMIDFTLSGTPPIQAYSYKFCHTDNRYLFLDITIPTSYIVADTIKRLIHFNIDQSILDYRVVNKESVMQPWVWVKGDRVRLLGYVNADSVEYFPKEYDLELSIDGINSYTIPYQNLNFSRDLLIEIYRDVAVNGDPSLYFECGEEYLITNPRSSIRAYGTLTGTIGMYSAFERSQVPSSSFAFLLSSTVDRTSKNAMEIFDVSSPTRPVLVKELLLRASAVFVTVVGNNMYVLYDAELQVWDISNISNPTSLSITTLARDDSKTIRINAGYAYIVHGNSARLETVDISIPTAPVKYADLLVSAGPEDIAFKGTYGYISGYGSGVIDVIDISNPKIPVLGTPIPGLSNPRRIMIYGDYLYVPNSGTNQIKIYNISNGPIPVLISTTAVLQNPYSVFVKGDYLYLVAFNDGSHGSLQVLGITNKDTPVVLDDITVGRDPWDLYVVGKYAYTISHFSGTMSVVDISNPATLSIDFTTAVIADTSYRSIFVTGGSLFNLIESKDYSDLYKSDQGDLQRVAVHSLELRRKRIIGLKRWSGVYLQNTNKNDLSFVDYANYDESNETFGGITKIFEYGDILTVRQKQKNTSYYLSKAVLNQAAQSGVEIISTSTSVLGSLHQSAEKYGCQHPSSHVSIGTVNFYIDVINSCIVRDGFSESVEISNLGIKNFIKDKFSKSTYTTCVGGYNFKTDELIYVISVTINNTIEKYVLLYNDQEKTWKSFLEYWDDADNVPECFGNIGNNLYAFNQGKPWWHEGSTDYSKFFGETKIPSFKIIGKGDGKVVFKSIKAISNTELQSDQIYIFDNATYARMQSKLPKMVKKENWYFAPFLRNQLTNSPSATNYDLFNGDSLRGECLEITLKPVGGDLIQVFEVEITTTPSL